MANEVSIKWGQPTQLKNGKWQVRVEVCNLTNRAMTVLVADNPWKGIPDPKRPYAEKLYTGDVDPKKGVPTRESTIDKAKKNGKKLALRPAGQRDACRGMLFTYPWKPNCAYTDVFIVGPGGVVPKKPAKGGAGVKRFDYSRSVGVAPDTIKPYYASVVPLPFPASAESETGEEIRVKITRVDGVPEELTLIGTLPPLGEPVPLGVGDRVSEATVLFRQEAPLEKDVVYPITLIQEIVSPEAVSDWPERRVSFDLVGVGDPSLTEVDEPEQSTSKGD